MHAENNSYPEERRLVTVLFADVRGFTALADHLDFELVSDLMRNVWLKLDRIIEEYGGYIDKHMGDSFMVVWGAPQARENDAEQAVSAGIAILEALDEYKNEATIPEAQQLELGVGIHSGLALAGYVGLRGEYTVLGDTVNVAKRLEEEAKPGVVVISEATYRFVRGAFRMSDMGHLKIRGKEKSVQIYQVIEALQQPTKLRYRSLGGLKTNLVRREAELQYLERLYHKAQKGERPILALVVGELGIGKSRLMMELASQIEVEEPNLTLISSRSFQQTSKVPFYLWRTLWANLFDVQEDDSQEIARQKFIKGIGSFWSKYLGTVSIVETAHFIGDLVGITWPNSNYLLPLKDEPAQKIQRAFALHVEFLFRARSKGPLVLVLDDLQWADRGSINLLSYLMLAETGRLPIFILAGCRPQTLNQYPQLREIAEIIPLKPLPIDPEMVREAYPALESAPSEILSQLVQRAEGNPFYLEEMVKSLVREGHEDLSKLDISKHLPSSLHLLLQARLDSLSPEARGVALLSAVVGRVFWEGAVIAALQGVSGTTTVLDVSTLDLVEKTQSAFNEIVEAELAFPRAGSTFIGDQEYIFKHPLFCDVAYSLLPHKHRAKCHLAVANWLAERIRPELSVMAAEHYEKAGVMTSARRYYLQAADHAHNQGNFEDAKALKDHLIKL